MYMQLPAQENEIEFAENFGRIQGRFLYCANTEEMIAQLKELIAQQAWTQVFCRESGSASTAARNH